MPTSPMASSTHPQFAQKRQNSFRPLTHETERNVFTTITTTKVEYHNSPTETGLALAFSSSFCILMSVSASSFLSSSFFQLLPPLTSAPPCKGYEKPEPPAQTNHSPCLHPAALMTGQLQTVPPSLIYTPTQVLDLTPSRQNSLYVTRS